MTMQTESVNKPYNSFWDKHPQIKKGIHIACALVAIAAIGLTIATFLAPAAIVAVPLAFLHISILTSKITLIATAILTGGNALLLKKIKAKKETPYIPPVITESSNSDTSRVIAGVANEGIIHVTQNKETKDPIQNFSSPFNSHKNDPFTSEIFKSSAFNADIDRCHLKIEKIKKTLKISTETKKENISAQTLSALVNEITPFISNLSDNNQEIRHTLLCLSFMQAGIASHSFGALLGYIYNKTQLLIGINPNKDSSVVITKNSEDSTLFTFNHQMPFFKAMQRESTYTLEITYNINLVTGMIQNGKISYLIKKDNSSI